MGVSLPAVIYEDETMIAFDKPNGLAVVRDRSSKGRESLMEMVREQKNADLANVHRLDPEASGVVLCAKTKPALDFLSGQFQGRTAGQRHHAMVVLLPPERAMPLNKPAVVRAPDGTLPESFTVELPLEEDAMNPGKMRLARKRSGKPAVTEIRVLERFGAFAFVECRPLTGRMHQIRLHLEAVGAPVLNDALYGDTEIKLLLSAFKRGYKGREEEKPLITRLALHASELVVKHPVTGEPVTITAALPHEFEVALKYLRKFAARAGVQRFDSSARRSEASFRSTGRSG